jgi:hypothetical protein
MTITIRPRWSLGRGKTLVPSRWQATTRRALAHTGQLTAADVERMEVRVRDWLRVVG